MAAEMNVTADYIRDNFLEVNIYLEEMTYLSIEETPAYTGASLIGVVGGHLGVFMGVSILTMMEFAEFVVCQCKRLKRKTLWDARKTGSFYCKGRRDFKLCALKVLVINIVIIFATSIAIIIAFINMIVTISIFKIIVIINNNDNNNNNNNNLLLLLSLSLSLFLSLLLFLS